MDGRTTHQWILFNQVDAEHVTTYSHLNCSMTEWWWFQPRNESHISDDPQDIHGPWRLGTTHLGLQDGTHPLRNLPSAGCSGGESSHAHWEVWENVFGTPWESFGNPLGTPWDTHFGQFTSPFLSELLVRWPTSWSPWQNLSAGRRSSTILVRWSRCSRWEYAGHMSYVNLSSTYVRMHGYVWICMYVCLYLYIYICVCMYIYLYIYIYDVYVCIYIYIYMGIYICTHPFF